MIAYFQFRAGMGGHFFLRTLLWRYGYSPRPIPNSYWNEYHFPLTLWEDPNFKRIPWDDDHGERWYDWATGKITEYSDEPLRKNFQRQSVRKEVAKVKKDGFLLEHGLYPKFTETFQEAFGQECATFSISTRDINVARFARALRDVKGDCKNHFGIRETTPEANKIREQEVWVENGPPISEMIESHGYNEDQDRYLLKQCELEKEHCDFFLDYEKLCAGSKEPWQMIDEYYKKDSLVAHNEVAKHCRQYHRGNLEIYKFKVDRFPN